MVDDVLPAASTTCPDVPLAWDAEVSRVHAQLVGATALTFLAPPREESKQTAPSARPGGPALSPAQRRVLIALCRPSARDGFALPASNREIAAELVISTETVKTHLHALFEAFGLQEAPQHHKRARLARLALERRVVLPHELDQTLP